MPIYPLYLLPIKFQYNCTYVLKALSLPLWTVSNLFTDVSLIDRFQRFNSSSTPRTPENLDTSTTSPSINYFQPPVMSNHMPNINDGEYGGRGRSTNHIEMQGLLPKYYSDINRIRAQDYSDYDKMIIKWNKPDNYEVIRKIGRGKYSDVFEGIDIRTNKPCVLKTLKPVKKRKIKREIKILKNLYDGPNIVKLLDVVKDPASKTPTLVFEHIENTEFRSLYPIFSSYDVRYYIYELLKALDYCHSQGIMHRDVKPHNIVVNPETKEIRLIDWGLAEFYHEGREYNVRVASRYYKGPELLIDQLIYDYSLDIWSLGCVFAGIIFQREPFFYGQDNFDQLVKISRVLGTEKLYAYANRFNISFSQKSKALLGNKKTRNWDEFITDENKHLCCSNAIDLVNKMLVYDHTKRITPFDAMRHPYFSTLRTGAENSQ